MVRYKEKEKTRAKTKKELKVIHKLRSSTITISPGLSVSPKPL